MSRKDTTANPYGKSPSLILKKWAKELSGLKTGLDVGCAHGEDSRYLASLGIKMDAVDKILPDDIKTHKNVSFQGLDILDFSFDKTYDVVLSINSLQFLTEKDRKKVMDKMYSSLNRGGLLFIVSFTALNKGGTFESCFKRNELRNWAEEKGLVVKYYKEESKIESHEPYGKHRHELVYLVGAKGRDHTRLINTAAKKALVALGQIAKSRKSARVIPSVERGR